MYGSRVNIYDLLDTLSLEMKEDLLEYLKADIAAEKAAPEKSYLEEKWIDIKRLIEKLKYEPYIDDQVEIDEIWDICKEMIQSGKLNKETWKVRREVAESIIGGEYFDYFCVRDPMKDLLQALIITDEEKRETADIMFEIGSDDMKRDGVKLYRECGHPERCIAFLEQDLNDKEAHYAELMNQYKDKDPDKAIEIAELGLKKCKDDKTELILFLIQDAKKKNDSTRVEKLLKSAKARKLVDYSKVAEALNETE